MLLASGNVGVRAKEISITVVVASALAHVEDHFRSPRTAARITVMPFVIPHKRLEMVDPKTLLRHVRNTIPKYRLKRPSLGDRPVQDIAL